MKEDNIRFLSIIIPVFNEEKRIRKTLLSIDSFMSTQSYLYEIICVLNNTTDNSKQIINSLSIKDLSIIDLGIIENIGNTKGLAVREGVLRSTGSWALMMDADNATEISELTKLLEYKEDFDIIIGSRRTKESVIENPQPLIRVFLGFCANILIQTTLVFGCFDTQCGFKLFRRNIVNKLFGRMITSGWGFDIEILAKARAYGIDIKEVGIIWREVEGSHVKPQAYKETFYELWNIFKAIKIKKRF